MRLLVLSVLFFSLAAPSVAPSYDDEQELWEWVEEFEVDRPVKLQEEPVQPQEKPDVKLSKKERVKKFVRQHKRKLVAAAVISLATVAIYQGRSHQVKRAKEKARARERERERERERVRQAQLRREEEDERYRRANEREREWERLRREREREREQLRREKELARAEEESKREREEQERREKQERLEAQISKDPRIKRLNKLIAALDTEPEEERKKEDIGKCFECDFGYDPGDIVIQASCGHYAHRACVKKKRMESNTAFMRNSLEV